MTMQFNGSSGITFSDNSTQNTAATGFGFKNRLINGAMMIDQRNAGASVTVGAGGTYLVDRWQAIATQASKLTAQQNSGAVTPPAGYTNYLGFVSSSAYSVLSSDYFGIRQQIEGLNVSDLGWGTSSAASVTLSFWVRSSLTGTFGGSFGNSDLSRTYPFSYTISSANTWEQKTVTVAGDTSGAWLKTSGIGVGVNFGLGVGSTASGTAGSWASTAYLSSTGATSVVGTNGATFYITGVQLEKGSTATSFDYRPYGTELALCQRYFYSVGGSSLYERLAFGGVWNSATSGSAVLCCPVSLRKPSEATLGYSSLSHISGNFGGGFTSTATSLLLDMAADRQISVNVTIASGATAGQVCNILANNTLSARLYINNEL